jgi:DNA-binding beta-propeller fold protein YncE
MRQNCVRWHLPILSLIAVAGLLAAKQTGTVLMGKQPDGSYVVATGQRILPGSIPFKGRPSDIALRPSGDLCAVMEKDAIFLCRPDGIIDGSKIQLGAEPGFRGLIWTPDGSRLIASTAAGYLATFDCDGQKLTPGPKIKLVEDGKNPVPGGMDVTRDGHSLFVAAADLNSVIQVDLASNKAVNRFIVGALPFQVRLSGDETKLIVTNWAGRIPQAGDRTGPSGRQNFVVDAKGATAGGTVTIVDLYNQEAKSLPVGNHPTDVVVKGNTAYVANSLSDSISEIDLRAGRVTRTIPLAWGSQRLFGSMPSALAVNGNRLYSCDGGDNAICEVDLATGRVLGFRPAGFYPIAMVLQGSNALVLNSKGNGSVYNTERGRVGNAHDFEGTVSVVDINKSIASETSVVAANNGWDKPSHLPDLAVYHGAIKHVLYIIKENRTYDEIFGDMPEGNGDAKLCDIGEKLMPNHRALAREFTLFDNAYVSGTNSCDGHAWSTQSMADDYIEHFYVGYSRTYNDDGNCAMSLSSSGCIWDAAAKKHKTIRIYGEYCVADMAEYQPSRPKDWFEAWKDRQSGTHKFRYIPHASYGSVKPYMCPTVHYWPLIQSDQSRADEFIKEYSAYSAQDKVPNLMVFSLPCDHTEGERPEYPAPKSMIADNDLALGRIVEAVSHSPQWKNTCIFVIEDDAQSGPDHVDGHRTAYMVISPYNRRHTVDSNLYTTVSMLKSIELMLGLDPMNRFDSLARPIDSCFVDQPDLTPYTTKPNNVPLDLPNPGRFAERSAGSASDFDAGSKVASRMTSSDLYWTRKSLSLDWSHLDAPDPYWLNRIIWASLHKDGAPYPARDGEAPGRVDE